MLKIDQQSHFQTEKTDPSFLFASIILIAVISTFSTGLFAFKASLNTLMIIGIVIVILATIYYRHQHFRHSLLKILLEVCRASITSIYRAKTALVIFILIGLLIAAFIAAGTVPTLIYWGLAMIHPSWFLPAGLLFCSIMSIATGTSWGTVGTAGVVLIGIGTAMNMPLPLVAGVIVSGACFGDKMSPVSDTTNLAAMSSNTDLYRHIRSMCYTTIPTYILVLLLYTLAGWLSPTHNLPCTELRTLMNALSNSYRISWIALLPLILLLGLSLARIKAILTMGLSALFAMIIAVSYQDNSIASVLKSLWWGGGKETGIESLNSLLGRGGVLSIWPTMQLSLLALTLGGILLYFGFMRAIIAGVLGRVRKTGTLISSAIFGAFLGNLGMGEAYMSIILGGQLFQNGFDRAQIDRAILSRSLEEGATLTTPLIPWTTAGIFFSTTLGISTMEYLPYAWLNLLNPLVGIAFGYLGWGLLKTAKQVS